MSNKTLTPRDVLNAGGTVTDELLEPFTSGSSDHEITQLRRCVAGAMSFFSKLTDAEKQAEIDEPIISLAGTDTSTGKPASRSRSRASSTRRKGGKK